MVGERECPGRRVSKWRARGAPHHAQARARVGRATMWCGHMVGPPGQLQAFSESPHFYKTYGIIFIGF